MKLVPAQRLLIVCGGLLVSAIPLPWLNLPFGNISPTHLWLGVVALSVLIACVDMVLVLLHPAPQFTRESKHSLALGEWCNIALQFYNKHKQAFTIEVFDGYPTEHPQRGLPQTGTLPAQGWLTLHYAIRPMLRGSFTFSALQVRIQSRLGLWQKHLKLHDTTHPPIRVYPNFASVAHYALLGTDQKIHSWVYSNAAAEAKVWSLISSESTAKVIACAR